MDTQDLLKNLPRWGLDVAGEVALLIVILIGWHYGLKMLTAWGIYLFGALCLMRVWWFITRKIPIQPIRQLLRLVSAVVLLTPAPVNEVEGLHWAPAVMMSALEGLFVDDGSFARAGIPLLVTTGIVVVLYVVLELIWLLVLKPRWDRRNLDQAQRQQQLSERQELIEQSRVMDS